MKSKQLRKMARKLKQPYRAFLRDTARGVGPIAAGARRAMLIKGMR